MSEFQTGDLFACYGSGQLPRLITWATASLFAPAGLRIGPSHVAICCPDHTGQPLWVESTTLSALPCSITGRKFPAGAQAHDPARRIQELQHTGGEVRQYRLTPIFQLDQRETCLLRRILIHHFVRAELPYDLRGAITSGTRLFRLLPWLVSDVSTLFCSELIAAALMRLGRLPLTNPARYHPARLLRELVRNGTYQRADLLPSTRGTKMRNQRSEELQARLREAVLAEIPRHRKFQSYELNPALAAAIAGVISLVVKQVVGRCTEENPFETVAEALTCDDEPRRRKAERILKARTWQVIRRDREFEELRNRPFTPSIPEIAVDSLIVAAGNTDEDDRLDYVVENTSYELL